MFANTAPIWVTIAAALLFKERIRPGFVIGLVVALSGAALLMGLSVTESPGHLEGDLFGLLTGVFYACYLITLKRLRGRYSTATVMVWSALPALLPLGLLAAASGERFLPLTLAGWGVLLLLALIVHAGGQSLIGYAFAHSLGFAILSGGAVRYRLYSAWGLSALEDQNLGGVLMTGEQAIVFLVAIGAFVLRLLHEEEAKERELDERLRLEGLKGPPPGDGASREGETRSPRSR